jgi:hypothetical protein
LEEWERYERLIALLCSEEYSDTDTTVIPNAKIMGAVSGVLRQVDVLIDRRFDERRDRRIVVDAKRHARPLDVKDVEEFEGMLRDCAASKGILVCPNGFTPAAKRRATDFIDIRIVALDELDSLDLAAWDDCSSDGCLKRKSRGLVLWDSPSSALTPSGATSVFCVGKCDRCSNFHLWCWDCGKKFALGDEDEHQCCGEGGRDWFWLTAIEEEDDGARAVYLLLTGLRDVLLIERKPAR